MVTALDRASRAGDDHRVRDDRRCSGVGVMGFLRPWFDGLNLMRLPGGVRSGFFGPAKRYAIGYIAVSVANIIESRVPLW